MELFIILHSRSQLCHTSGRRFGCHENPSCHVHNSHVFRMVLAGQLDLLISRVTIDLFTEELDIEVTIY